MTRLGSITFCAQPLTFRSHASFARWVSEGKLYENAPDRPGMLRAGAQGAWSRGNEFFKLICLLENTCPLPPPPRPTPPAYRFCPGSSSSSSLPAAPAFSASMVANFGGCQRRGRFSQSLHHKGTHHTGARAQAGGADSSSPRRGPFLSLSRLPSRSAFFLAACPVQRSHVLTLTWTRESS
jgi:hypothetical protein